jgi:hypothetical protein
MRLSLLLILFAADASAVTVNETLTLGTLTIVPCPGYTLIHYADGILQYKCPSSGLKINWPCAHPVISTAAGNHSVAC